MLSKCANPACSNVFRYLHEGKLFLIDSDPDLRQKRLSRNGAGLGRLEYAWLCSYCCRYMTIRVDEERGTMVLRKAGPGSRSGQETGAGLHVDGDPHTGWK